MEDLGVDSFSFLYTIYIKKKARNKGSEMTKEKKLSEEATLIRWAKKDIAWIRCEASHRRLTTTNLIRMVMLDWLRHNAETKELK